MEAEKERYRGDNNRKDAVAFQYERNVDIQKTHETGPLSVAADSPDTHCNAEEIRGQIRIGQGIQQR
jgi:hypothetical protein